MSTLSHIPTSSYNLGRLSLVIPKELQPQIKKFYYKWYSRTEANYNFAFGYPVSLQEYPLDNGYSHHEQWVKTIVNIKQKYKKKIILEWSLNSLFSRNAYFISFKEWRGEISFCILVQESKCILHYIHKRDCRANEIPKKDNITDNIIKSIFDFYKLYRSGHCNTQNNVFFTYFGEILGNRFTRNERMLLVFNNEADNLSWGLQTKINLGGDTEDDLNKWMQKIEDYTFIHQK